MLSQIRATWRSVNRLRRGIGARLLASVLLFSAAVTLILTLFQLYFDYRRGLGPDSLPVRTRNGVPQDTDLELSRGEKAERRGRSLSA